MIIFINSQVFSDLMRHGVHFFISSIIVFITRIWPTGSTYSTKVWYSEKYSMFSLSQYMKIIRSIFEYPMDRNPNLLNAVCSSSFFFWGGGCFGFLFVALDIVFFLFNVTTLCTRLHNESWRRILASMINQNWL